jgi:hypothetical protein
MTNGSSHGHYLTLIRVTGVSAAAIDKAAQEIHEAFMDKFGPLGAFTAGLFELTHLVKEGTNANVPAEWNYALRYFGPTTSVAWLQQQLESTAKTLKAEVTTETYTVRDITGKY